MNRFTKGNSRRYFRYDLKIKYFISPQLNYSNTEIQTNGINYFNRSTEEQIVMLKALVLHEFRQIHRHQDILRKIVQDIFLRFDIVMNYLRMINQGEDVRRRQSYWSNREKLLGGFESMHILADMAPRTYDYMCLIEKKFVLYSSMLQETVDKSTKAKLHFSDYPEAFLFESEIRQGFERRGVDFAKNPLIRFLIALEKLFEKGFEPFNNLASDYLLYQKHESWIEREVNLSACGLSIFNSRIYPNLMPVNIKVLLQNSHNDTIEFEGKVVRSRFNRKLNLNETAIDFYFPKPTSQQELLSYLHRLEVRRALEDLNCAGNQ